MKKGNVLLKIVIVFIICLSIFSLEVQANDVNLEADDMVKTYGDENSLNSIKNSVNNSDDLSESEDNSMDSSHNLLDSEDNSLESSDNLIDSEDDSLDSNDSSLDSEESLINSGNSSLKSSDSTKTESNSENIGSFIIGAIITVAFLIIFLSIYRYKYPKGMKKEKHKKNYSKSNVEPIFDNGKELTIERQIRQKDQLFRREDFTAWVKKLFVELQQAWTARDWSSIKNYESPELYEQHRNQLQGYIDNNQINVIDRIYVNFAALEYYKEEEDKEIIMVKLNSKMTDYVIDASTKELLEGDPNIENINTYRMTFERNKKIKTNEYGWVLVKLQRLNGVNELRANSYRQQSKKEFTYSNIERNTEKESNKEGSVLSKIGIKNIMKTEQYKSTNNSGIGSSNYEEKWECECGIKNVGKYCVNCGKQKPTKE